MKWRSVTISILACSLAHASGAAAQQWEVFFDSKGFEELPLGPLKLYPDLLPHRLSGTGSGIPRQVPEIAPAPDPAFGDRSMMFRADRAAPWGGISIMRYSHESERFGKRSFAFPGTAPRGGYRGLRVSFDLYHLSDEDPGVFTWGLFGGVLPTVPYILGGDAYAQIVWDVTERVPAVFDEWVHVSITMDFEHALIWGSYGDHESEAVPLTEPLDQMDEWWLEVNAAGPCDCPTPILDVETAWVDNLVIEVIPPCPADCDLDYAHTFFDFLCFQNMFAAGASRADCDGDGDLTVFDFLCFQNYFTAGCD